MPACLLRLGWKLFSCWARCAAYCVVLCCAQSLLDAANRAREAVQAGISPSALNRTSVGMMVGMAPPQVAALLVFEEISHITRVRAHACAHGCPWVCRVPSSFFSFLCFRRYGCLTSLNCRLRLYVHIAALGLC